MITVKELIERLQGCPPEAIVVQARDGEGNDYSPLADLGLGFYTPETTWNGEWTDQDEYRTDKSVDAICLIPTN